MIRILNFSMDFFSLCRSGSDGNLRSFHSLNSAKLEIVSKSVALIGSSSNEKGVSKSFVGAIIFFLYGHSGYLRYSLHFNVQLPEPGPSGRRQFSDGRTEFRPDFDQTYKIKYEKFRIKIFPNFGQAKNNK